MQRTNSVTNGVDSNGDDKPVFTMTVCWGSGPYLMTWLWTQTCRLADWH